MTDELHGEIVTWKNTFGFIRPDREGDDIFFHVSALPKGQSVDYGTRVIFKAEPDPRKPSRQRAVQIKIHK